tara:strand:+ start:769 stop:1827 length:1059 start_codon:yes stop_codon:yes gene_type:complete
MNSKIQKLLVRENINLLKVIENLSLNNVGIVFVVDNKNKLLGTITDGDVRRGILKFNDMNTHAANIMRKNPKYVTEDEASLNQIEEIMIKYDILHVPIVNKKIEVIDLKTKSNLYSSDKRKNSIIISAGGFGKRLKPLTNNLPKPMIKIDNVPILEIIINKFIRQGFFDFYISTYFKSDIITKYFGNGEQFGVNIKYIEEMTPLGTAGSLSLIDEKLLTGPIILMNSDIITEVSFHDLLSFHKENKSDATICTSKYEFQVPYGEVKSNDTLVTNLVEKPIKTMNINAGIYVLEKNVIQDLIPNKPIDIPEIINNLINKSKKVSIFPIHEYWTDIGHIDELNKVRRNNSVLDK